jgi:hypothetical protein
MSRISSGPRSRKTATRPSEVHAVDSGQVADAVVDDRLASFDAVGAVVGGPEHHVAFAGFRILTATVEPQDRESAGGRGHDRREAVLRLGAVVVRRRRFRPGAAGVLGCRQKQIVSLAVTPVVLEPRRDQRAIGERAIWHISGYHNQQVRDHGRAAGQPAGVRSANFNITSSSWTSEPAQDRVPFDSERGLARVIAGG